MIKITPNIELDESELSFSFVRASGPGGQNVNKVSSAVELRFDVARCLSLPDALKERLKKRAGRRLTKDGLLIIAAQRFRTQGLNRKDALERLVGLLQSAAIEPKIRKATRPSRSAREKRLQTKRQDSLIKQTRRTTPHTD